MTPQLNLDLLEATRLCTEDLTQHLIALKFQVPFNSDERRALDSAIGDAQKLLIIIDGIFFRHEENIPARPAVHAPEDNDIIQFPMIFPQATKKIANGSR